VAPGSNILEAQRYAEQSRGDDLNQEETTMNPMASEKYVPDTARQAERLPGALASAWVGAKEPNWVEHTNQLNPVRRTKIVCTMGPASVSEAMIAALIEAGLNVARLNFSHGTHAEHAAAIQRIRRTAKLLNQPVAILQDLQGPKIRTGNLIGHAAVELKDGMAFTITTRHIQGTAREVSTTYAGLADDVRPGDTLLLDDGLIELSVEGVDQLDVHTRVVHGGLLKEHKGINLPGVAVNIPILTEKDLEDLAFGVAQGVDYIAVSFVNRADDIVHVKRALADLGPNAAGIPIIAKLEKPAALTNLEAILEIADGVMVARGDLAVELSPQLVPPAQNALFRRPTG
jgi:pyruvate kinase